MISNLLIYVRTLALVIVPIMVFLGAQEDAVDDHKITVIVSGDELRGHQEGEFAAPIPPHMLDGVMTVTLINPSEEPVLVAGDQFHRALEWQIIDEENDEILFEFTREQIGGLQGGIGLTKGVPNQLIAPMRSVLQPRTFGDEREGPVRLKLVLTLLEAGGAPLLTPLLTAERKFIVFTDVIQWETYSEAVINDYDDDRERAMAVVNILASYDAGMVLLSRFLAGFPVDIESYHFFYDCLRVALGAGGKSFIDTLIKDMTDGDVSQDRLKEVKGVILGMARFDLSLLAAVEADPAFAGIRPLVRL